jgi:AAA family ATP:ADP antiporter
MADRFTLEQSKRFFGVVAVGGTLGAMFGPWLAQVLAEPFGTPSLLLVAVTFLLLAVGAARLVTRLRPATEVQATPVAEEAVIGGSPWAGFRASLTSPYLLGISGYVLILAVTTTFIYFTRLAMVAEVGTDLDTRTTLFAQIDLATQAATLLLQLLVTGHLMRRLGVPLTMALLPIVVAIGFAGLTAAGTLAALVIFDAVFRAVQRAIMRPSRETLFTVVPREDKYKSKAFIDTFVYRAGDVAGAWTEGLLGRLGMGLVALSSLAVPLAVVWAALGVWLGREQARRAASGGARGTAVGSKPAPAVP